MGSDERKLVVIFYLRRHDGSCLFLHPFYNWRRFLEVFDDDEVDGRVGEEPILAHFRRFRHDLYRMADAATRRWVLGRDWPVHVLGSSWAFSLTVLFLSYLHFRLFSATIEPLVAVGMAAVGYGVLYLLAIHSKTARTRREELRQKIDRITFREDPFVVAVERELERVDSCAKTAAGNSVGADVGRTFGANDPAEAFQLFDYLRSRIAGPAQKTGRRGLRLYRTVAAWASRTAPFHHARRSGGCDSGLLQLYDEMKGSLSSTGLL